MKRGQIHLSETIAVLFIFFVLIVFGIIFYYQNHIEDYYFDLFSYSPITVTQLYPEAQDFILYDKPKPESAKKESTHFVVSLRDDASGSYGYGFVTVEVYS